VDRLIASFSWVDWFEAKLLEKENGVFIDVYFSNEISALTKASKVSVRVSQHAALSKFALFTASLKSLLSVLRSR